MKKFGLLSMVLVALLFASGCGSALKQENAQLKTQMSKVTEENTNLKNEVATLTQSNDELKSQVANLTAEKEALQKEFDALKAKVAKKSVRRKR